MENNKKPVMLKDIRTYILKSLKFHDLKNEYLTPVVFLIILCTGFIGSFIQIPSGKIGLVYVIYNIISFAVMYLASAVYLYAHIKELKGESYSLGGCTKFIAGKSFKIIIASFAFTISTIAGAFLLLIPGIIIYTMFVFYMCIIVEKNRGIMEAFGESKRLTSGLKMEVFSIMLVFNFLLILPLLMIIMATFSSSNNLVFSFVLSFAMGIFNLMQQRLIALMYVDLQYGRDESNI